MSKGWKNLIRPQSSFGGLDYWLGGILSALGPRGLGGTEGGLLRTFLDSGQLPTTVHSTVGGHKYSPP